MDKKQTKQNFFKRNIYYFVVGFILVAAIALTVILFLSGNNSMINTLNSSLNENQAQLPNSSIIKPLPDQSSIPDQSHTPTLPDTGDSTPTQKPMTFIMPVNNATIICDYTATSVVYNKTLGIYTGHMAIDFSAEQGAEVKVVCDGKIESIVTTYLTGTTITVVHDDNVKTVYNSVEAVEGLTSGQVVKQGDVIAYVSDNNKQEYKDGPHLHFEVYQNGEKISPYKYLSVSDK